MNVPDSDPLARRLRLLVAREFATRGYHLDVEGMFERVGTETMNEEELELLAKAAALRGDWTLAEKRFGAMADRCADPGTRTRAQELEVYAQQKRQQKNPELPSERRFPWLVVVAFLAGAAILSVVLWACGWIEWPVR